MGFLRRLSLLRWLFLAWLVILPMASVPLIAADSKPSGAGDATLRLNGTEDPAVVARMLDLLKRSNRNVVVTIGDKPVSGGSDAGKPAKPADSDMAMAEAGSLALAWTMFSLGFDEGNRALPALAQLPQLWAQGWAMNRNGGWPAGLIGLVLALAAAAALGVRALLAAWTARRGQPADARMSRRFFAAAAVLAWDLACVAAFGVAGHYLAGILLPEADLARRTVNLLGASLTATGLYLAFGRFLLAPADPVRRFPAG